MMTQTITRLLLACLCVAAFGSGAAAQTVNPTAVEFEPSADHAAVFLGSPVVTRYELRFQFVGATEPVTTVDLGKPSPQDGKIRVTVPQFLTLTPNTVYEARVAAIGPGGEGVSTPTDPFGRSGPPAAPTAAAVVR